MGFSPELLVRPLNPIGGSLQDTFLYLLVSHSAPIVRAQDKGARIFGGPFSGMGCIGDLDGVVSATAGAGVGAGATGVAGFQLDLLAKCSTLRSSAKSGSKRDLATTAALCTCCTQLIRHQHIPIDSNIREWEIHI